MSSRSAAAPHRPRAKSAPAARSGAEKRALVAEAGTLRATKRAPARRTPRRRQARRRGWARIAVVAMLAVAGLGAVLTASGFFDTAVREIVLPLKHEDVIRQQAADKGIDAALLAGVIYTESRFRDGQESSAGALGLMQITPATARDIARKSGGTLFEIGDLATAQVNISYGAYYLRYLLNRFGGDEALALAAYNGGEGNVERWVAAAQREGRPFKIADIPFTETREYVGKVRDAEAQYRSEYPRELGL